MNGREVPQAVISVWVVIDIIHPDTADIIAPPPVIPPVTVEIREADVGPSRSVQLSRAHAPLIDDNMSRRAGPGEVIE
jgi:hypothetical protein